MLYNDWSWNLAGKEGAEDIKSEEQRKGACSLLGLMLAGVGVLREARWKGRRWWSASGVHFMQPVLEAAVWDWQDWGVAAGMISWGEWSIRGEEFKEPRGQDIGRSFVCILCIFNPGDMTGSSIGERAAESQELKSKRIGALVDRYWVISPEAWDSELVLSFPFSGLPYPWTKKRNREGQRQQQSCPLMIPGLSSSA